MAEENLTEKCARCGHTREEHAQFIDNQVGSKTYVPERRKCLHHELKSGVACYDCECHHFLTESEKRAQDAQDAVLMPDLEKHVKAAAEALDDADVEKKFPSTAVELARKCGIETTEFGAVSVLDSYIVGLQEMVTQLKDQAVDKDTLAQLKRIDQAGMEKKLSSNAKAHAEEREQSKLDEERERKEAIASFQETERSIIGADCTKCGACCCPPPDAGLEGNLYVELTHSDLVRLGPSAGPHLGPSPGKGRSPNTSGYHLRAYKDNDGQVRCPFFVGDVGDEIHNCGCGIYEQRPYACQLFPKGGDGCRIARRSHPRINPHLRELSWKTKQPTPKYHQGVTNELLESERYARQAEAADSIDMKVEVGEGEKLTHFVHDEFVLEKTDESAAASE